MLFWDIALAGFEFARYDFVEWVSQTARMPNVVFCHVVLVQIVLSRLTLLQHGTVLVLYALQKLLYKL